MNDSSIISKYFPDLHPEAVERLGRLGAIYGDWNQKVNLISRKDMDQFYIRHVLHSLTLMRFYDFHEAQQVMDLGTGGGFPGIPLAICFPETNFLLVDSIRKKIHVVEDVIDQLGLVNAAAQWTRAEEIDENFDMVVTRAVAKTAKLIQWTRKKTKHLLALKGGDLFEEIYEVDARIKVQRHPLKDLFTEPFYETKVVLEANW